MRGAARWPAMAAAALGATAIILGLYALSEREPLPAERPGQPPVATRAPVSAPPPERFRPLRFAIPREALSLPSERTDPLVRGLVSEISSHPEIASWLASDDLVRSFTQAVANVADGSSPSGSLGFLRPEASFEIIRTDVGLFVDPRSYERYDLIADAFASLDPEGTAALYAGLKPLIQQTYRELGYEASFDEALATATLRLLRTPVPDGSGMIPLRPLPATFEFADPELAELDDAQKHLLRTGPRNVRVIQAKLRELAPALGLRPGDLP